ncbi:MAG TPA: hypothetical protein VK869_04075 [Rubrobacteraceae bacterium]|nr:hypothetical protein [Rubrobacteraceae bacterium]
MLQRWRSFWARLFSNSHGSARQRRVLEYIARRIEEGASLDEAANEEYVRRQATSAEVARIRERPELVQAVRERMREEMGAAPEIRGR